MNMTSAFLTVTLLAGGMAIAGPLEPWGNCPKHNMVREAENTPTEISEEHLVWQVDSGTKHTYPAPTIVGDKVLIMSTGDGDHGPYWTEAMPKGGALVCRDLRTGEQVWRHLIPYAGYGPGTYGICGVPAVIDDKVYILGLYDVLCLDMNGLADGNQGFQGELELMMRKPFKVPEGESAPEALPEWAGDVLWHYDLRDLNVTVQDATSSSPVIVDGQMWVATGHEIGSQASGGDEWWNKGDGLAKRKEAPHLVVFDMETGELIARDNIDVPIVFHGAWSSPSLIQVNGEKAVIYADGYGVLNAFAIPEPAVGGTPTMLKNLWSIDLNLHENRYNEEGKMHPYTRDKSLGYKYPADWPDNMDRWFIPDGRDGYDRRVVGGPSEIISMPTVVDNRIYVGLGGDYNYDMGPIPKERGLKPNEMRGRQFGPGRFVCLQVDDVTQPPKLLWEDRDVARTQATASVVDGLVYNADNAGFLNCWDAMTGEVIYRYDLGTRMRERSQLVADGKIYIADDRGTLKIIKAGRTPELLDEHRFRNFVATVEVADGLLNVATSSDVFLFSTIKPSEWQ